MQLNYWNESWPLDVRECPCDMHFLEYLRRNEIEDKMIFHFGTGEHHILGRENVETNKPNEILAITASRQEYESYIEFVINHPAAAKYYKVLFADIYTLTRRMVPKFDLVTLFHLCEFYDSKKSSYAQLNDASLLSLFVSKLNPGGKILFYKKSFKFHKAKPIIQALSDQGMIIKEDEYKTLLIYGRPGSGKPNAGNHKPPTGTTKKKRR